MRAGLLGWLFRYGLFACFACALLVLAGGRALYRHLDDSLPEIRDIERYRDEAPGISRIDDRDGAVLSELAREPRG